jgi:SAM-dependent methyltransferase
VRADELQRMYECEDSYWWFRGRKVILVEMLRLLLAPNRSRRILDVGCGSGATLLALREFGEVVGLDRAALALHFCRQRGLRALLQGQAGSLPIRAGGVDLVTLLDVLEHLFDDRAALREMYRVLAPGGWLFLAVPAYPFLWSEHDEALSHWRRYTAPELRAKVEAAGFTVARLSYAVTTLLPLAAALRMAQRLSGPKREPKTALIEPPRPVNLFFYRTLVWEAHWLRSRDLPCGLTVLCAARKEAR